MGDSFSLPMLINITCVPPLLLGGPEAERSSRNINPGHVRGQPRWGRDVVGRHVPIASIDILLFCDPCGTMDAHVGAQEKIQSASFQSKASIVPVHDHRYDGPEGTTHAQVELDR
jgi:hypothetical protein